LWDLGDIWWLGLIVPVVGAHIGGTHQKNLFFLKKNFLKRTKTKKKTISFFWPNRARSHRKGPFFDFSPLIVNGQIFKTLFFWPVMFV
jgi:hypothetical protein